jgi:hypothetical protein
MEHAELEAIVCAILTSGVIQKTPPNQFAAPPADAISIYRQILNLMQHGGGPLANPYQQ